MYSCESKTDGVRTLLSVWEVMPLAFKSQELFQGKASQALRCADHYSSNLTHPIKGGQALSSIHFPGGAICSMFPQKEGMEPQGYACSDVSSCKS